MKCKGTFYALGAVFFAILLTGCGGAKGGGTQPIQKTTPTLTWATPAGITYGTALSGTQLNATASTAGTFTYSPVAGTVLTAGTQTLSVTFTPSDTTDYNTASASVSITVAKATPTITWATPASITNTTALSSTQLNASANVAGSFAYSPTAGTTLAVGTDTLSVTFTPTDATDYNSASASVSIVVTLAPPTITSLNYSSVYCENYGPSCILQFVIKGTNFAAGDTLSLTLIGNITLANGTSPTQIGEQVIFNTSTYSPGLYTYKDCRPDGVTCSNTMSFMVLPMQNTLVVSTSGELFQNDEAQGVPPPGVDGYVREFQANGATLTAGASPQLGFSYSIAHDDTTSQFVLGDIFYPDNGNGSSFNAPFNGNGCGSNNITNNATKSGYAAYTCPSGNVFGVYPLTPNPTAAYTTLTSQPSAVAMGTTTTGTNEYVLLRNGTVTLEKLDTSANPKASVALPGITPISTVQAANPFAGGWAVAYGQGGTGDQTAAVLSTPDNVLDIVNTATMQVKNSITLPGLPFRVVYDATHGKYIVAFANLANTTTTFAAYDPVANTVTNLASTSSLLAVGLAVSADGNYLYVCMRSSCETQPNK